MSLANRQEDTLLVGGHRNEPFLKGEVAVLEDSTDLAREVPLAHTAAKPLVLASDTVVSTAIWADDILLLANTPPFLDDCLSASVLVGEVVHNLNERIELSEIYHKWPFL